jgi:hypothetical protein
MADPTDNQPKSVLTAEDRRNLNLAVLSETTNVMNPIEYEQIKKVAKDFWSSGALSKSFQNETQIVMAMLAGREMGMTFNESVNDLYFVNGKLNVYGKATPAALRRHGWRIQYTEESPDSCTATLTNPKTGEEITDTFTFMEAEQSGFTGSSKPGWLPGANRRRKLRYGVLSLIIHTYIPEVLGATAGIGEYTEDYMDGERLVVDTQKQEKADATKARIAAAETKRKEMDAKKYKPKAVPTQEAEVVPPQDDDEDEQNQLAPEPDIVDEMMAGKKATDKTEKTDEKAKA